MLVLVSGASGLIGSALVPQLLENGHSVKRLVRKKEEAADAVFWDPETEIVDSAQLKGVEAAIHLAGENIAGRWTEARKKRIRESRLQGTRFLRNILGKLEPPPKTFICASAMGYYGDRGDELLNESSEPGSGFLAELCREWEATTVAATQKGMRVVNLRTGLVLSTDGGALAKMLTPFKMGAGGIVGDGNQYWSWIALDDHVAAIVHLMNTNSIKGPVNLAAPNPVTNREFTRVLGKVLSRPTFIPVPAFAAKMAFGEMADELLLSSARVDSSRLVKSGFEFQYPELEGALRHVLAR